MASRNVDLVAPRAVRDAGRRSLFRPWRRKRRISVNLALQGGGSHGAFTWGVLDRLLEYEGFECRGLSGTSAGALNAVVLAQGWLDDGPQGARRSLDQLWRAIADHAVSSRFHGAWSDFAIDTASRLLSPYQLNPFGLNPLGNLLHQLIDVEQVKARWPHPLLLAATNRRTGRPRLFTKEELSIDVMLASACLPQLYQAVEINGESYWDGGYTSNPPVIALIEQSDAADLLLIKINPVANPAMPVTANGIRHRVSEIVFGQPLLHELERLDLARRLAAWPWRWFSQTKRRLARHNLVMIDGSAALARLDPASRLQIDWQALLTLKDRGRETATAWLAENQLIEVEA